jgi:hypothetical protein
VEHRARSEIDVKRAALFALGLSLWFLPASAQDDGPAARWIAKLDAKDPGEWREAAANVARLGSAALPALEKVAAGANEKLQGRVKATLAAMLLESLDPALLDAHEKLRAIARPEIEKARTAAACLVEAESYDSGELGPLPPTAPPPPPTAARKALADVLDGGAFAVPVALELCAAKTAASRFYGIDLLRQLGAHGQARALETLAADKRPVSVSHGDYSVNEPVGTYATSVLVAMRAHHKGAAAYDEGIAYLRALEGRSSVGIRDGTKLMLLVRDKGRAGDSRSWDDFWKRARPVLAAHLKDETR